MKPDNDTMRQAMRLMQAGDLHAATRTLQQALGSHADTAPAPSAQGEDGVCIEGEFRVVDRVPDSAVARPTPPGVEARHTTAGSHGNQPRGPRGSAAESPGSWFDAAEPSRETSPGRQHFSCGAGELEYLLHIPPGLDTTGAPLLLMLHGCTQTPEDFARGTRMDQLAGEQGYVVAWPAQSAARNQNRCWNWFRRGDQQRGRGEPAILAALTRQLVARHRLDAGRVYVAGLSAGGAMAAVLASTHPDVYAAIGVHSGLPVGLASDVPSAFAAMRSGGPRGGRVSTSAPPVPAIIFHGDSDTTVHPDNGTGVMEQSLGDGGTARGAFTGTVEAATAPGRRAATRNVFRMPDGRIAAEHWVVHGAGHAWSGGDPAGSYTDPRGPDASQQMLRFFAECVRRGEHADGRKSA